MARSTTPVRGVGGMNSKDTAASEGSSAIDKFAKVIPDYVEDDIVLFGRAPENTRVTVGDFRNPGSLKEKIGNYVKDIRRSVNDEHVVKTLEGRTITVGDLRDYADAESLPANPSEDPNGASAPNGNTTVTDAPEGAKPAPASDALFGDAKDASGSRDTSTSLSADAKSAPASTSKK